MKIKILILLSILIKSNSLFAAKSYIKIMKRCSEDSLSIKEAIERNAWAKKCFPKLKKEIVTADKNKPRMYALVSDKAEKNFKAPRKRSASCAKFIKLQAFCIASCYTPEVKLLFSKGYIPIGQAFEQQESEIMGLAPQSTLENPVLAPFNIDSYSVSWRDTHEIVRKFTMLNGAVLRVTLNHPIVNENGQILEANHFRVGDSLIQIDGSKIPIIQIDEENYFGKVYNLAPESNNSLANILIAEGFLMGSAKYQYEEAFQKEWYKNVLKKLEEENANLH